MPRKPKSYFRRWQPEEVVDAKLDKLAIAYGKFGLVAEAESKKVLRKKHGVLTGTLRRSIHAAKPGYQFKSDDVQPSASSPERGGQLVKAGMSKRRLSLLVGSGLVYALKIHGLYKYLTIGLRRAKPKLPGIIKQEFAHD